MSTQDPQDHHFAADAQEALANLARKYPLNTLITSLILFEFDALSGRLEEVGLQGLTTHLDTVTELLAALQIDDLKACTLVEPCGEEIMELQRNFRASQVGAADLLASLRAGAHHA